jgi:hypothetical protein
LVKLGSRTAPIQESAYTAGGQLPNSKGLVKTGAGAAARPQREREVSERKRER